jgi:hypothetical protein
MPAKIASRGPEYGNGDGISFYDQLELRATSGFLWRYTSRN